MNNKGLINVRNNPNDLIYTPSELSEKLISFIPIKENDILLDGFKGNGSFYNNFPESNKKDWCEIEEGRDFFCYNKKINWCISNPPFSMFTKILKKSSRSSRRFLRIMSGSSLILFTRQ